MPETSVQHRRWFAAVLLTAVVLAYLPVILHGGFIWDDPQYITENPVLRTLAGLAAIWIHPTSIPQYYPVVHTLFWIEYHLWGLHPLGYHFVNVLLHAAAAVLLWRVLLRLQIPAAGLAAAIFALHPVNVESVAWATERKNVLSLVFYLLSLHAYLNFATNNLHWEKFNPCPYVLSLAFFLAALLSKSVTCSLPAAIVLLIYWRHGRVRRRDIWPLLPFFALGLAMALITGHLEAQHVGASGHEWPWTFPQRVLIAGRALWFYAGKLIWPNPLVFIYPKWRDMDFASRPWLIAFPLSAIAVATALWLLRRRIGRGPLVAVLFFAGTLLPALGFVNLFPMRYSFVADHFQYAAAIGLIVLFASILHRWFLSRALAVPLVLIFAVLTWRQQSIYQNALVLWEDTTQKNPTSWMTWGNLGDEYALQSYRTDLPADQRDDFRRKSRACYVRLNDLAPDQPVTHLKWGIVREFDGDWQAAVSEFAVALQLEPDFSPAMNSMGLALMKLNRPQEAMDYYRRALAIDPGVAEVHYNYAVALEGQDNFAAAAEQYLYAIARRPDYPDASYNLANLLLTRQHRPDLAIPYFASAVSLRPNRADYRVNYAIAFLQLGQLDAARQQCRQAMQIDPAFAPADQLWQRLTPQ